MSQQHEPPLSEAEIAELEMADKSMTAGPWAKSAWSSLVLDEPRKRHVADFFTKPQDPLYLAFVRNLLPRLIADLKRARAENQCAHAAYGRLDREWKARIVELHQERDQLRARLEKAEAVCEAAKAMKQSIDEGFDDIYEGSHIEIGHYEYVALDQALAAWREQPEAEVEG